MELLFVYALLYVVGYDVEQLYRDKLDELFLANQEDEELLELEETSDMKTAALHVIALLNSMDIDGDTFGSVMMRELQKWYQTTDIHKFSWCVYLMWNHLPEGMRYEEPFVDFCTADDYLDIYGEQVCRDILEQAFHFYSKE